MNYSQDDEMIVDEMHSRDSAMSYKNYIMDRFIVKDVHTTEMGLCATIYDYETDMKEKYFTGDRLADGSVQVTDRGVMFVPNRADMPKLELPTVDDMHDDKEMDAYGKMMGMMQDEPMEFFGDEDDEGMVILILNKHDM